MKPEYKKSEIGVKEESEEWIFSSYDIQLQMIQIYDFKQAKHNKIIMHKAKSQHSKAMIL